VIARKAAEYRASHGIKTWDAIHLATAIVGKADVFIARDHKLKPGNYEGVCVTLPFDYDEGKLVPLFP